MRTRVAGGWIVGLSLLVGSMLAVGCINVGGGSGVVGSGPVITEDRPVGSFDKVVSQNGLGVVLSIGDATSVKVTAQESIVPLVTTTVADGTLTATLTQPVIGSSSVTVTVVSPSLTALTLRDGTSATVTGLAADSFTLAADNGAHADLSGTATNLTINANNGAFLQMGNLVSTNATVTMSNGVTGQIHATGTVSGSASDGVLLTVVGGGTVNVATSNGAIVTSQ